jgi:hypothetical protein
MLPGSMLSNRVITKEIKTITTAKQGAEVE